MKVETSVDHRGVLTNVLAYNMVASITAETKGMKRRPKRILRITIAQSFFPQ